MVFRQKMKIPNKRKSNYPMLTENIRACFISRNVKEYFALGVLKMNPKAA